MMESSPTTILLDQLLSVLRGRLAEDVFANTRELVGYLDYPGRRVDVAIEKIQDAIRAVGQSPANTAESGALLFMAGMHPSTASPRKTRSFIKGQIGNVLEARSVGFGLSERRVEQLERDLLAPLVAVELGIIERLPARAYGGSGRTAGVSRDVRLRPIFVQYCNPELFKVSGLGSVLDDEGRMLRLLTACTRLALLMTDDLVLFPASYLFELPAFPRFLNSAAPMVEQGLFGYVSPTADLDVFRDSKSLEYRDAPTNPYGTTLEGIPAGLIWRPRTGQPTSTSIASEWTEQIASETGTIGDLARAIAAGEVSTATRVESELAEVPARLEGRAFIGGFVREVIDHTFSPAEIAALDLFLSDAYLRSYLHDLDATILVDFEFADLGSGVQFPGATRRLLSVRPVITSLRRLGVDVALLERVSWKEFLSIRSLASVPFVIDALSRRGADLGVERSLSMARHPTAARTVADIRRTFDEVGEVLAKTAI